MGADYEDEMFDFLHLVGGHAFKLKSARHMSLLCWHLADLNRWRECLSFDMFCCIDVLKVEF